MLCQATECGSISGRTAFVTAVVLLVGAIFIVMGVSSLGYGLIRLVLRDLKVGVVLGAGMRGIYGDAAHVPVPR